MSRIVNLDHVQVAMPAGQEAAARAFYSGVLGLTEEVKPPNLVSRGGVWFRSGALRLHLGVDPNFRPAGKAHPALLCDGLMELARRCLAAGFPPIVDEPLEGCDRIFVLDPFGNRIELLERREDAATGRQDLLDRLLGHDAWTTRQLLKRCRELSDQQLDSSFDIGHRSVRATLNHIVFNMEAWSALMAGVSTPPTATSRADQSIDGLEARLDRAALALEQVARAVRARDGWDERWLDVLDNPPKEKTYGGAIAHVITHSMHHRAQVLYMLRQLGVPGLPEGDVLTWEQQREPA